MYDPICVRCLEQANADRKEVEVTRGWAWDREEFVKINGISVWDDEQVLEMDIGNGYTTL